jgi:hypothetical protein
MPKKSLSFNFLEMSNICLIMFKLWYKNMSDVCQMFYNWERTVKNPKQQQQQQQ